MTPQAESILTLFQSRGAYLKGHFRLTSGLHSPEYLQCALVLQHPQDAEHLGQLLADKLRQAAAAAPQVVVSPALGGLIIGHEVARALGTRFIFAERDETGKMTLRRGFQVTPGEAVAVVEDVITTGGSTHDVVDIVRAAGGNVVAAGSIIDRSGGRASVGTVRIALATLQTTAHYPPECPLCVQGIPLVKPGSRST